MLKLGKFAACSFIFLSVPAIETTQNITLLQAFVDRFFKKLKMALLYMYLVFHRGKKKRRKAQIISAFNATERSHQIGDG